jgi:hypothetical protein
VEAESNDSPWNRRAVNGWWIRARSSVHGPTFSRSR